LKRHFSYNYQSNSNIFLSFCLLKFLITKRFMTWHKAKSGWDSSEPYKKGQRKKNIFKFILTKNNNLLFLSAKKQTLIFFFIRQKYVVADVGDNGVTKFQSFLFLNNLREYFVCPRFRFTDTEDFSKSKLFYFPPMSENY
jgi:hypothetical protein